MDMSGVGSQGWLLLSYDKRHVLVMTVTRFTIINAPLCKRPLYCSDTETSSSLAKLQMFSHPFRSSLTVLIHFAQSSPPKI